MLVSLIKGNRINNLVLPKRVIGNYWITDYDDSNNEQNLISIEASDNTWRLISNEDVVILENNEQKDFVVLREYSFYLLKLKNSNTFFLLYCSPNYDSTYSSFYINANQEITIGNDPSCAIRYNNSGVDKLHAKLAYYNNQYIITDNNSRLGVYVNNKRVRTQETINNGDIIFVAGLKIIAMVEKGLPVLIINNPDGLIAVSNFYLKLKEKDTVVYNNDLIDTSIEQDEVMDVKLYNEDDFFHKKPRFKSNIETFNIKIDAPPSPEVKDELPLSLTLGPMVTMGISSIVMGITSVSSVLSKNSTWKDAAPSVAICIAMLGSLILWPSLIRYYENKKRIKKEQLRQYKYSRYIDSKRQQINETIRQQSQILAENNMSLDECQQTILKHKMNLWERKFGEQDFLTVTLGRGTLPMDINIEYPEEHFYLEEDNLRDMVIKLGSEPKKLNDVPITFSLYEKNILALIGNNTITKSFADRLLLQLVALHSYDELKIVLCTSKAAEDSWDYMRILPHAWNNDKSFRYFGGNNNDIKEICYQLDNILTERLEKESDENVVNAPYYLIVTDTFRSIRNNDFIKKLLSLKDNKGFGILILNDKVSNLPTECNAFINVSDKTSDLFENVLNTNNLRFQIDFTTPIDMYECAKELANTIIEIQDDSDSLPNKYGFLEMYDVGKVEQLNSLNRWQKNNPILTLQAPIGVDKSGDKISLDLHEKFHGPHGLVAGSTGSGKSEFIVTYILSMAVNYHPNEVQFILIDYKGGGLAGSFENKELGIKLPHLAGTITNLDASEINRSLASIESELKRRQKKFNEAREKSGESSVDIYKYQKLYRDGVIKEPIAHLFIISDEFAELKSQQPEFMQQLISTARIGRSLGVHLILATQKPTGVVDNQIWSNTRFRVCLKVQEKSDSQDVIKCPDAAMIKQTGRFYLQVGYNEIFELGQSAFSGGKYYPSEKLKKSVNTSIDFVDDIGLVIKSLDIEKKSTQVAQGQEINNIVKYLADIAKTESIKVNQLWLDRIPNYITVDELITKYPELDRNVVAPIIGEYDDPSNQWQDILRINYTGGGNAIVYGVAGSGKENLITAMLYSSMKLYTPEDINYYLLDFGSESLKVFDDCPLVGDVLISKDRDKINGLYRMLTSMIEERKKLFAPYGGSYDYYIRSGNPKLPIVVTVINNYEVYDDAYIDFDETLLSLTREGSKYGVCFFLAVNTPNGIRFKTRQNFTQEFVLQQNNENDYVTILGNVNKNYPSKIKGRGIIKSSDDVYEFQTAYPNAKNEESYAFIKNACEVYKSNITTCARKIPTLPDKITFKDIKKELGKNDAIVIGYSKETLSPVKYDFNSKPISIISGMDLGNISKFIRPLIKQFTLLNNDLLVIDTEKLNITLGIGNLNYVDSNFEDNFLKLYTFVTESYDLFVKNEYDKTIFKDEKQNTIVICGLESFKNKLSVESKTKMKEMFEKVKDLGFINFIIIDSVDKIKKFEVDGWYKTVVNNTNGIWVGNGISEQFSIKLNKITKETREEIGDNFCYVVSRGKPILTKYVESFDILED